MFSKMYRLKKEAVPFLNEKHATDIYPLDVWESLRVDIRALEEVKPAFISYGVGSSLSGWGQEEGSKFHFTINFPSLAHREYDEFSKGRHMRDFMDMMQREVDRFYFKFLEMNKLKEMKPGDIVYLWLAGLHRYECDPVKIIEQGFFTKVEYKSGRVLEMSGETECIKKESKILTI